MKRIVAVLPLVLALTMQADDRLHRSDGPSHDPTRRPDAEFIQLYVSLSELPLEEQRAQMWGLSSKSKAALWKYNLEQYLQKHAELGLEEQNVLLEGIRLVTTPAWFDIEEGSFGYDAKQQALAQHKRGAEALFQPEAIYEIFLRLGPEPPESRLATAALTAGNPTLSSGGSRRLAIPRVNQDACHCTDSYECWYWGSGGYECFISYCSFVRHCGFFHDEMCLGKCKWNG